MADNSGCNEARSKLKEVQARLGIERQRFQQSMEETDLLKADWDQQNIDIRESKDEIDNIMRISADPVAKNNAKIAAAAVATAGQAAKDASANAREARAVATAKATAADDARKLANANTKNTGAAAAASALADGAKKSSDNAEAAARFAENKAAAAEKELSDAKKSSADAAKKADSTKASSTTTTSKTTLNELDRTISAGQEAMKNATARGDSTNSFKRNLDSYAQQRTTLLLILEKWKDFLSLSVTAATRILAEINEAKKEQESMSQRIFEIEQKGLPDARKALSDCEADEAEQEQAVKAAVAEARSSAAASTNASGIDFASRVASNEAQRAVNRKIAASTTRFGSRPDF
jgi:hypothetical protein